MRNKALLQAGGSDEGKACSQKKATNLLVAS